MNTATTAETAAVAAAQQSIFVTVPDVTLPNGVTVPSFQVGQYFTSKSADGLAAVTASGAPWTDINYFDARQACVNAGFALLTELQALAIAFDVSQQGVNWTSGKVGEGAVIQGLHQGSVDSAQPGDFVLDDDGDDENRFFTLSNGQVICDVAGNLFSWIFDDVQGDALGIVAKAFTADSPSITTAPYPSMESGMGWRPDAGREGSGLALIRGGCWDDGDNAGVFRLGRALPGSGSDYVGFRCTKP